MILSEKEFVFHSLGCLSVYYVLYPPKEFIPIGWTTDQICLNILGFMSEYRQFIQYHQKRTALTALMHSLLLLLYVSQFAYHFDIEQNLTAEIDGYKIQIRPHYSIIFQLVLFLLIIASLIIPLVVMTIVLYWYWPMWQHHPLTIELQKYAINGQHWQDVATSINDEFRT